MKKATLALLTEWVFSQGRINSQDDLVAWSVYLSLKLQTDGSKRHVVRGAAEILQDLYPIWKKLSYGGRSHDQISIERRQFLENMFGHEQIALPAA